MVAHPYERHIGTTFRTHARNPKRHPVRTVTGISHGLLNATHPAGSYFVEYREPGSERTHKVTVGVFGQWLRRARRVPA